MGKKVQYLIYVSLIPKLRMNKNFEVPTFYRGSSKTAINNNRLISLKFFQKLIIFHFHSLGLILLN
jgi:hypothetical protein